MAIHIGSRGLGLARDLRSLGLGIARAAALGAITWIDPNKQTGWRKHAYWLVSGGLAAVEVLAGDDVGGPGSRPGLAVGAAGFTYGARDTLAKGDAWTMRTLTRFGLQHPRRWVAGATAVGALAMNIADVVRDRRDDALYAAAEDDETAEFGASEPMSAQLEELVASLLDAVDGYGSDELKAQLAGARIRPDGAMIDFEVADDAPRTLIGYYTYPVSATFERGGRTHFLTLDIDDGRLAFLSHYAERVWEAHEPEPDWSLPRLDELTVRIGARD